ncbi:MAG: hypothetical protein FP831_01845, partial [Anaerolineae bacterium]|nr:hypothetical protein [Anaerolineae bacterium]
MDDPMNLQPSTSDDSNTSFPEQEPYAPPLKKKTSEMGHMEAELRLTLEEIARLQNALAESNMKNNALQTFLESLPTRIEGAPIFTPVFPKFKQSLLTIK